MTTSQPHEQRCARCGQWWLTTHICPVQIGQVLPLPVLTPSVPFEVTTTDRLTAERDALRAEVERLRAAFDEWLSKSEWVQETATPSELGMHRADVLRQRIERLAAERDSLRAEVERLRADAELYRWLRGGSDVPSHSLRWPRWEVRRWDGRYWQTLFGKQIDDLVAADIERDRLSIDAARAAQKGKT